MKSFLPFLRRSLSSRSLLLSIFLVFISVVSVQAKTVVIGTGFGFISVPNMKGLDPGDAIAIQPGTYRGGTFVRLNGITITNNGGAVKFNGTGYLQFLTILHIRRLSIHKLSEYCDPLGWKFQTIR